MNKPQDNLQAYVTRGELYEFGQELAQTIIMGFQAYMDDFRAELNERFAQMDAKMDAKFAKMDEKFDMRFDYQEKRLDHLVDDVADIKQFLKQYGFHDRQTKLKA